MSARPQSVFIGSLIRQLHTEDTPNNNSVSDLLVLVSEVKGLKDCGLCKSKAGFYCEIELNGDVVGRSSCKQASTPDSVFWGERFLFVNLRVIRTATVKFYRDLGKRRSPSQCIGHIQVPTLEAGHGEFTETWYPLEGTSRSHSYLQLRVRSSFQQLLILDPLSYQALLQYVLDDVGKMCQVLEPLLPSKSKDELAQTLVYILKEHRQVVRFMSSVLVNEVETLERENLILRANSFASKSIDCYMKLTGTQYLKELLTPVVLYIIHSAPDCEVDPTRLLNTDKESLEENQKVLMSIVERVWTTVYQGLETFPPDLRFIFSDVRARVADRGETMWKRIVSGTVFLRFFCPAILSPSLFHLTNQYPDERACRRLTLVAKVIQNLANATRFGGKESYMVFINDFMDREMPTMDIYLNQVSSHVSYHEDLEVHGVRSLAELMTYDLQVSDNSPGLSTSSDFDDLPIVSPKNSRSRILPIGGSDSLLFDRKPVTLLDCPAPVNRDAAILQRILAYHLPRLDPLATQELDELVSLVAQLQTDVALEKAKMSMPPSTSPICPVADGKQANDQRCKSDDGRLFPFFPAGGEEEPVSPNGLFQKCLSDLDSPKGQSIEINL
ncbi:ras GTPase-activating protein gap-2-like isoform X1 [Sycon ciliatum]|uniref:ras GTPase-activating protein gap-2-like isoform X1 n=1 Tax=Sycon ciliatum TaxID=27933 RepID=UPI0020ADA95A|eukprot:scpid45407/ scgid5554/ Ras GTPase-activating protein gap-2